MAQKTVTRDPKAKRVGVQPAAKPGLKPDTQSSYAQGMSVRWSLADALMGGSEAMRRMGKDLLPKHKNEDEVVYVARLNRSFLLPVFAQAVENLTDIVFSEALTHSDKLPADLLELLKDVDSEGNSIDAFAKLAFSQAMARGECYLIADEPPIVPTDGKVITLADRNRQKVRPYLAVISADNMLAYETVTKGGHTSAVYARWREVETRQGDDFVETMVQRVIEWKPGVYRKFEKIGDGDWGAPEQGALNFMRDGQHALPIYRFRVGNVDSAGLLLPPLHGLAEKNVEHWQSSSDQRAILTVSRFPMLGGSGVNSEDLDKDDSGETAGALKVGPNVTLFSRSPDSKFYYVEPEGKAIEAGKADLERLEKDMAQLAYQPLMRQQAGVTATTDALGQNKANSSLSAWAAALGVALDAAVGFMSIWKGAVPPETAFKPTDEFGIEVIDSTRVTALQALRNSGDLSRGQLLKQMQRERVLDEEFDAEANQVELENEGPRAGELDENDTGNLPKPDDSKVDPSKDKKVA